MERFSRRWIEKSPGRFSFLLLSEANGVLASTTWQGQSVSRKKKTASRGFGTVGVEQRRELSNLDQAVAHEIAELQEYDLLAE